MKELPQLDAEVSGLLAEIAADPRSRLRLAPTRALRSWYLGDETLRPRGIDATAAERHLVAAHRDALADVLLCAARVAYWRRPCYSIPLDRSARLYDPGELERNWCGRRATGLGESISALVTDPSRIRFEDGEPLAEAALTLVPSDAARLVLACLRKESQPRSAARLLDVLTEPLRDPTVRGPAFLASAACLALTGDLRGALTRYRKAADWSPVAFICQFNLHAFTEDPQGARSCISSVETIPPDQLSSTCVQLRAWVQVQPTRTLERARGLFESVSGHFQRAADQVSEIYAD